MELTDLKRTDAEKSKEVEPYGGNASEVSDYPYGLTIHLDSSEIEKLGLDAGKFPAGTEVKVIASGVVESISTSMVNGKAKNRLNIQLQKMRVDKMAEEVDRLSALYGGG